MKLPSPRFSFTDGNLHSLDHDDVYHSAQGAIAQSQTVFIEGNHLDFNQPHCIGELGFGAGINFLTTLLAHSKTSTPAPLTYVSFESTPFQHADLKTIYAHHPELQPFSHQLIEHLPHREPGFHIITFNNRRVRLILYYGDALEGLREMQGFCDAWYLDGFAPRLNESMWSRDILEEVARHSRPGARAATWSVSSSIVKTLTELGFTCQKCEGFGNKKHRLEARFQGETGEPASKHVAVIGSGLAGTHVARAFADRGQKVTVYEAGNQLASGASGNPGILVKPLLASPHSEMARLSHNAFSLVRQLLKTNCQATGALQIDHNEEMVLRHESFFKVSVDDTYAKRLSVEEASETAGFTMNQKAVWFEGAGWLDGRQLVTHLLNHPSIQIKLKTPLSSLEWQETNNKWLINQQDEVSGVVLATSLAKGTWHPCLYLPFKRSRGQTVCVQKNLQLRQPMSYGSYTIPREHDMIAGSTFHHDDKPFDFVEADTQKIIDEASAIGLSLTTEKKIKGWAGERCHSRDTRPIAGPLIDVSNVDRFHKPDLPLHAFPHLYTVTALGSRGGLWSPLLGEHVASLACGTPSPISFTLSKEISPERFVRRALRKQELDILKAYEKKA